MSLSRTSRRFILVAVGLVLLAGALTLTYTYRDALGLSEAGTAEQVENLHVFATLYGYVRYFHPSDAAADTDWETFATYGAQKVKDATSQAELRSDLETLFKPIAPTVQLYRTDDEPPSPADVLAPPDTSTLSLVAWQHRGVGLGNHTTHPFRSTRLNRPPNTKGETEGHEWQKKAPPAQVIQALGAAPYRGQQLKIRAAVKVDGGESRALLSLFPFGSGGSPPFGEIANRTAPITSQSWSTQTRTLRLSSGRGVVIGGFVQGDGTAWFDDVELFTRASEDGDWTPVPLSNPGFESERKQRDPIGWSVGEGVSSYVSVTTETAHEGSQSLKLTSPPPSQVRLFAEHPDPGEVVTTSLGRGLSVQVPLALYSRNGQTLRPDDAPSPEALADSLAHLDLPVLGTSEPRRLGSVTIAWNVFQHFYPYFDVVDVNWDRVLTRSLHRSLGDTSRADFQRTLQRMVARLKDGHGRVYHSRDTRSQRPLRFDQIAGNVVVADTGAYAEGQGCARPGDVVVSLDGRPADEALRAKKRVVSGSPQWVTGRALRQFGGGPPGTSLPLTLRRDGRELDCQVPRADSRWWQALRTEPRPASIDTLRGGVRYVDLTRVGMRTLRPRLDTLAQAEAVLFDMRGYPVTGNEELLQHLSPDTLRSPHFEVPKIIYPDRQNVVGYAERDWILPPRAPSFTGDVVFLTDARAISYAETIMGIVEHHGLGTIVGQPTAGANGVINPFGLPGNYQVMWTGMRVRKHDGSPHHLVGIRPDVPVERTIEGVRNGQDEVLRKGLEILRDSMARSAH